MDDRPDANNIDTPAMAEVDGGLRVAGSQANVAARLDRLPVGRWHIRARLILGSCIFFDAFDLLALTFALPALVDHWRMTSSQVGWIISSAFLGQMIGALIAGALAERIGRLATANLTIALFSVMSLACAFAPGPQVLMLFRFVQGIGLGGEIPVATTYVVEMAPAAGRGRFFLLYQLVFLVGQVAAALLGTLLVPAFGWASMFILGALPAALILVLRRALPESPRWLASRGRFEVADAIMRQVEGEAMDAGYVLAPLPSTTAAAILSGGNWREMFGSFYRTRTLCVWTMWFCCSSTTYGLNSWLPTLYRTEFHLPLQQALSYGLVTSLAGISGSFLCAIVIDKTGRRGWFIGGYLAGGMLLLTLLIIGVHSAALLLVFVSAGSFCLTSVAIGLNLYTPELYPTRMRVIGSALGGVWQRVAATAGPVVIGGLLPVAGLGSVFWYFGGLAIIGGIVTAIWAPETGGKRLEEVSP